MRTKKQNSKEHCRAKRHDPTRVLSRLLHWGALTWTYPEWQRIVYYQAYTAKTIKAESLAEYAAFEPFRTVGIENTFYASPNPFVLEEDAKHLPAGIKRVIQNRGGNHNLKMIGEEFVSPLQPQAGTRKTASSAVPSTHLMTATG